MELFWFFSTCRTTSRKKLILMRSLYGLGIILEKVLQVSLYYCFTVNYLGNVLVSLRPLITTDHLVVTRVQSTVGRCSVLQVQGCGFKPCYHSRHTQKKKKMEKIKERKKEKKTILLQQWSDEFVYHPKCGCIKLIYPYMESFYSCFPFVVGQQF